MLELIDANNANIGILSKAGKNSIARHHNAHSLMVKTYYLRSIYPDRAHVISRNTIFIPGQILFLIQNKKFINLLIY